MSNCLKSHAMTHFNLISAIVHYCIQVERGAVKQEDGTDPGQSPGRPSPRESGTSESV